MTRRLRIAIGLVLILIGGMLLITRTGYLVRGENLAWSLAFGAVGIIFLVLLLSGREYWWTVWPTCLFLSMGPFIYITSNNVLQNEEVAVGAFIFLGIALPFWLVLAFQGRRAWWWAIPAGILTFVALGTGMESILGDDLTGVLILWGIAIPFWIIFFLNTKRWWALIPAGTLTTVGVLPLAEDWSAELILAVLLGGLAVTFLLIYLLSGLKRELRWALWPAAGCAVAAVLFPFVGEWINLVVPALIILAGVVLLVRFFFRR